MFRPAPDTVTGTSGANFEQLNSPQTVFFQCSQSAQ